MTLFSRFTKNHQCCINSAMIFAAIKSYHRSISGLILIIFAWSIGLVSGLTGGSYLLLQNPNSLSFIQLSGFKISSFFFKNTAILIPILATMALYTAFLIQRHQFPRFVSIMLGVFIGVSTGFLPGITLYAEPGIQQLIKVNRIRVLTHPDNHQSTVQIYSDQPGSNSLQNHLSRTAPWLTDFKKNLPWVSIYHHEKPVGLIHHHLDQPCQSPELSNETLPEQLLFSQYAEDIALIEGLRVDTLIRAALSTGLRVMVFEPVSDILDVILTSDSEMVKELLPKPQLQIIDSRLNDYPFSQRAGIVYLDSGILESSYPDITHQQLSDEIKFSLEKLDSHGTLAVNVAKNRSDRDFLRIAAALYTVLQNISQTAPEDQIIAVESEHRVLLMARREPFPMKTIAEFSWLVKISSSYDSLWAPGMRESTQLSELFLCLGKSQNADSLPYDCLPVPTIVSEDSNRTLSFDLLPLFDHQLAAHVELTAALLMVMTGIIWIILFI